MSNDMGDPPAPPRSALSLFRYRIFRSVCIATLASSFGGRIQSVGAAWMRVDLGASPQMVTGAGFDHAAHRDAGADGGSVGGRFRPVRADARGAGLHVGRVHGAGRVRSPTRHVGKFLPHPTVLADAIAGHAFA